MTLRRARAAAQLLDRPRETGAAEVVRRLLAVQAQDPRAARLALRARTDGLTAAAVDAALTDDRSLVVAWLLRGTLHLVAAEDHGWLLALTAPGRLTANARRLAQEGVEPDAADRAVAIVERALADDGPLTRAQLAERIAAQGIRTEGQATPHLLALAALRGVAVLGPVRDGAQAFALARDWLGDAPGADAHDHEAALAELARRYLRGHGPAAAADLAVWSGLGLRAARAALAAIGPELTELDGGLVDLAGREAPPATVPPRMLGPFDPYLLGWRDRSFAVEPEHARRVHPGGGMLRAVATVDGAVVGTWTGRGELDLFGPLDPAAERALADDAADVARFLGGGRGDAGPGA